MMIRAEASSLGLQWMEMKEGNGDEKLQYGTNIKFLFVLFLSICPLLKNLTKKPENTLIKKVVNYNSKGSDKVIQLASFYSFLQVITVMLVPMLGY